LCAAAVRSCIEGSVSGLQRQKVKDHDASKAKIKGTQLKNKAAWEWEKKAL